MIPAAFALHKGESMDHPNHDNKDPAATSAPENFVGHTYERNVRIVFVCVAAAVLIGLYFAVSSLTVRVLPDPRGIDDTLPEYIQPLPDAQSGNGKAQGIITAIVERDGRNYARVEYYMPSVNMNCFFYEDIGAIGGTLYYRAGQKVQVTYDPSAGDSCGTSVIGN